MQLRRPQYYFKYAKVGHQQTSAFCSTDWVRSRDQFTCQQADFCLDHFHYYLPPHDTTETRQPRRDGRAEEDRKRPRVGVPGTPTVFLSFFSIILTIDSCPPPQHVPSALSTSLTPPTCPQRQRHVPALLRFCYIICLSVVMTSFFVLLFDDVVLGLRHFICILIVLFVLRSSLLLLIMSPSLCLSYHVTLFVVYINCRYLL